MCKRPREGRTTKLMQQIFLTVFNRIVEYSKNSVDFRKLYKGSCYFTIPFYSEQIDSNRTVNSSFSSSVKPILPDLIGDELVDEQAAYIASHFGRRCHRRKVQHRLYKIHEEQ